MKYVFQPGDRGRSSWDLGVEWGGREFTVIEGLKDRLFRYDGKMYPSYVIEFDHAKDDKKEVKAHALELIPPKRGSMDKKAGWDMLPLGVVRAMQEGPSYGNVGTN